VAFAVAACLAADAAEQRPLNLSGIYPHLHMWNDGGECGTGAVVPWQGELWAITYSPHKPGGSSDKLYQITPDFKQKIFADSVGGTPANRMIHRESGQLLIGPYLINRRKEIRVIPPERMFGRLTGTTRHLFDPQNKVYYATMEEGLYEVDVNTLEVTCRIRDGNSGAPEAGLISKLPGYHGKGLFSGQGRLIYANNGERDPRINVDPTITSGGLAEWFGEGDWQLVRRNQFTEVSGPGGIHGNPKPESDPIWSLGWDAKSLILGLLDDRQWYYFRLPKASHSYDGAHGWNTEWPRIREIGEQDLLATMHGTFWRFPARFSLADSSGIVPRSNYLKVIGDFCRWNDHVVLGCDDSAQKEFLNKRPFKADRGAPLQSNSNLWFVEPARLDHLGPPIGRGSVWLREDVAAGQVSDPYLFCGYDYRQLHLIHHSDTEAGFALEVDREGTNEWKTLCEFTLPPSGAISHVFDKAEQGSWIRITSLTRAAQVTANFQYRNQDSRATENAEIFAGIATLDRPAKTCGLMRSLAHDRLGLVAATDPDAERVSFYELDPQMQLVAKDDRQAAADLVSAVRQPEDTIHVDQASVLIVEDGKRYRLPKNDHFQPQTDVDQEVQPAQGKQLEDYLPVNLAKNAAITVSSTHDEYRAEHAIDGSLADDARWIGRNEGDTWIELDLGQVPSLRSIWVVTGWQEKRQYVAENFDIQTKVGDQWRTVPGGEIRDNSRVRVEVSFEDPLTARHVRLVSSDDDYFRIYEIALFDQILDIVRDPFQGFGVPRLCREVATERDLLNIHGTFYELPARNAQGAAKMRPIATHNLAIHDFCSHNGLLLITGIDDATQNPHIFRSADGNAAVWAGVVDDLWKLGKPRGIGGPWYETAVKAATPSDPYLMTAYDRKRVEMECQSTAEVALEVDVDGTGLWVPYKTFRLSANEPLEHEFPVGFSAYWVRAICDRDTVATVQFTYD
jgi:hypothetical protein